MADWRHASPLPIGRQLLRGWGHSFSLLWLDEDGKSWAAVVKRTSNDEAYLQSYRRARSRQVAAWTSQKEESGE